MDSEAIKDLLTNVTPGPWHVDGPPWNQIIWSSSDNRVCFMAHNSGLDDARDLATAAFIAAARDLVPALLARAEAAEAREQALLTSYDEERKALVESASLRERLKAAEELLQFIAEVAPVADKTCDEPGITFVEACRREMKERGK